jgi:hypothetical protein
MNKCFWFEEISRYLDNELKGAEKEALEMHLKECALCGQELARLQALSEKLKSWRVPDLDADFQNAVIKEAVRRDSERGAVKMKKQTLSILVPSGVVVTLLIVMLFGQMYIKRGVQGRLRQAADDIGDLSGPQISAFDKGMNKPGEYEPYYTRSARLSPGKAMPLPVAGSTRSSSQAEVGWNERSDDQSGAGGGDYSNQAVIVIQPVLPATGQGDMIIRIANMRLIVEDGNKAYKDALMVCNSLGGYLASSQLYKDEDGRDAGVVVMRIPKDNFLTALDKLAILGKVEQSSTSSQDVRQEYFNTKARLDAAMVVYNKMVEALQKKQATIHEAIRMESALTPVLQRIEEIKNKLESLNNAVSFTTVNFSFHEAEASGKLLKEMQSSIKERVLTASIKTLKYFLTAVPMVIAVIIGGVFLIVVALLVKNVIMSIFKRG